MRVVLAKQRKRKQPGQKRERDTRFDLQALNPLRPIWRWAQSKFVRQPSWHAFLGWQTYYSAYLHTDPTPALIHHSGPYVGSLKHQVELIDAMLAGRGAAIACAPPGCGKSRFALEVARRIEREHPRWHVVFVSHDERLVREELQQLTNLRRVLFIVDDAHDCPELVELLAATCGQTSASASSLHLLCLTRSTGRARVNRAVNGAFSPGMVHEIDLGRPSPELVRTLIDQLLPESSPHHRETIARFVRQSYFGAVLVCTALRRDAKLPQTFQRHDLRDRIARESLRDAANGVGPTDAALRILAVYAALAPVPKARADVREWAAQLSGLSPAAVDSLLERALKAGLFHEDSSGLMRPTPDLLGDLILEQACLDANGSPTPFSAQLLEQILEAEPVATVRNCAYIGQLFGTAQDSDLISRLTLERAQEMLVGSQWEALKLLQMARPLATIRPATVVDLVRIMETRGIVRRNPSRAELFSSNSVEMSACSLLLRAGEADPAAVPVALGLARDLYGAAREDLRSREHLLDELRAYCRFDTSRSLAHAQAAADTLRGWANAQDVETAVLCASLSAQYLPLEAEGQPGDDDSRTPSRLPLLPASEVWSVRDAAVDTLSRAMAHSDASVRAVAIVSLEHYADCGESTDRAWLDRWMPQLTRETDRLSAAIVKVAKEATALRVSAAAELQGWRWWARGQDVLQRAGETILQAISDTDAYRLWKLLYAVPLPTRTILPDPTPREPQDRLQHVQTFSAVREEDAAERARELFDLLDPRYPDISAWRALWLAVLEQSPRMPIPEVARVVVAEFARRHPDFAWSFVNRTDAEGPLFAVLPFLLAELGRLDRTRRSNEARNVPPGTRLEEAWLGALSFTSDFDEPERAILARGLQAVDSETVHHAADALLAAGGADRLTSFRRVFGVLAQRPTDSFLWELAVRRFVNWAEAVLPPRSDAPTEGMAATADELVTLLRTQGSQLRWGFQRHTRPLASALAIVAVLRPQPLQEWMQREWGQPAATGGRWSDESPLSMDRLTEIMRLIAGSPAAAQWIATFLEWMRHSQQLGTVGALGLAELCSLDDVRVSDLSNANGANQTDASHKAFAEFVNLRKRRERPGFGPTSTD